MKGKLEGFQECSFYMQNTCSFRSRRCITFLQLQFLNNINANESLILGKSLLQIAKDSFLLFLNIHPQIVCLSWWKLFVCFPRKELEKWSRIICDKNFRDLLNVSFEFAVCLPFGTQTGQTF